MKNNDTTLGENAVDGMTFSKNDVIDGIQKEKYEELYDYYLQFGFDALKRDFNLDISREVFISNCIKYVDKCPYNGRRKENLQICRNMYQEYVKNGFKGVVEKFNYRHSREVLVKWFKNLLDEYDSKARMRHVEKENVEKYTKIYEEYKKNGLLNLKDKFGCSNNRNFLLRQFKKYVKDYETVKIDFDDEPIENSDRVQETKFWKGFDLRNASLDEMTKYILEHSDYKNINREEKRIHYLIYMIVNKANGKIYVGQHETMNVDDNYMGSGSVLELAKNKYGIDNFKKIVLFDFKTFDEMNNMEIDIISDDFRRKTDCVYNRCNGGFNGPNSEFQKEMYRIGLWKAPNGGKVIYHDANGDRKYFIEGKAPYGWIKGDILDEDLHRRIDERMEILHSLGSNFSWREGVTVEYLDNLIEQFRKNNEYEVKNEKLWREIFDFYKNAGRMKTLEKYKTVDNIVVMERGFIKYFPYEFDEFRNKKKENAQLKKDEFEKIKQELESYGIKRPWKSYNHFTITKMYKACMRKKKLIDDKIAYYAPILEECFEHGIYYAVKKYNEQNLHHKFIKYLPRRYKEYMKVRHNKDIIVEENVYSTIAPNMGKYRKKRVASENELKRRAKNHAERVRLYNELLSLGSTMKYREDIALTTLRRSIEQAKINKSKYEELLKYYTDFYNDIMQNGYKAACKKVDYTGTLSNLKRRFTKYVNGFNYNDFDTST